MSLSQKIQEEKNRVASEVITLNQQNEEDAEKLDELKQMYNKALFSGSEAEIDSVNNQIKEVSSRMNRRKEMMAALQDKNNPVIQSMITEAVEKWLNEKAILEEQAEDLYQKLEPKHKELLHQMNEMVEMKYRIDTLNNAIQSYGHQLNDLSKKKVGLSSFISGNKVLNKILPLLIEHKHIFKVR